MEGVGVIYFAVFAATQNSEKFLGTAEVLLL